MKKLWALVLAGCIAAVLSTAAWASEMPTRTLQEKLNAGGIVTLDNDIEITSTLEVTRDVTLDLNGKVLKMTGSGSVIHVESGTLTLKDSNPSAEHKFTVDSNDKPWRLDETNGAEKVYGGVITGANSSSDGGGVYVAPGAKFVMTGGNIVGCSAGNGGGVYVANQHSFSEPLKLATFEMSGGTISGCTASDSGGGVYNSGNTVLSDKAKITNCRANSDSYGSYHGGGGIFSERNLTVSGDVVVMECTAAKSESAAMYVGGGDSGNTSSIEGGTFDGSVELDQSGNGETTVSGGTFKGEVRGAGVVIFYAQGGTPEPGKQIRTNAPATRPDEPSKDGYKFEGWYTDEECTKEYTFTEDEKVTGIMRLYAKWTSTKSEQPKYYYKMPNGETTETKGSPKTFDAGMGVYAGMAVMSLAGMACVGKKRH